MGEISHINTDLNLNPSLCYYPIFWEEGEKVYRLAKEIKLETRDKNKWIEFIIDRESRKFHNGFALSLPKKYFLEKQLNK